MVDRVNRNTNGDGQPTPDVHLARAHQPRHADFIVIVTTDRLKQLAVAPPSFHRPSATPSLAKHRLGPPRASTAILHASLPLAGGADHTRLARPHVYDRVNLAWTCGCVHFHRIRHAKARHWRVLRTRAGHGRSDVRVSKPAERRGTAHGRRGGNAERRRTVLVRIRELRWTCRAALRGRTSEMRREAYERSGEAKRGLRSVEDTLRSPGGLRTVRRRPGT